MVRLGYSKTPLDYSMRGATSIKQYLLSVDDKIPNWKDCVPVRTCQPLFLATWTDRASALHGAGSNIST